jgi:hypothetical protein
MPQSDRTVVLFFDPEQWEALSIAASKKGRTTDEFVRYKANDVARLEVLRSKLHLGEDPRMLLDGSDADDAGSLLIQQLADDMSVTIEVHDGERHKGKEFTPRGRS